MISGAQIGTQLAAIGTLLREHHALWSPSPFKDADLAWEASWPELSREVRGLSDGALDELENSGAKSRRFLSRWLPRAADRAARSELRPLSVAHYDIGDLSSDGVPARKWRQILAFASAVNADGATSVLEWCSGKGHLARALHATSGLPVTCVELDSRLVHSGRDMAAEAQSNVIFEISDVHTEEAAGRVRANQLACALHACGDLHLRLLALARAARTRAVAIAPCCYHLTRDRHYQPLSERARQQAPALTRDEMRLCVQETVLASTRVRKRRDRLAQWRLGFDLLQRRIRRRDEYLPVPPAPTALASQQFEDFVAWAAEQKRLDVPSGVDLSRYEEHGTKRYANARRLSVVRHLFRRPLEVLLVLDRAQALVEDGYHVEVGTFCERELTPRNILLRATLP